MTFLVSSPWGLVFVWFVEGERGVLQRQAWQFYNPSQSCQIVWFLGGPRVTIPYRIPVTECLFAMELLRPRNPALVTQLSRRFLACGSANFSVNRCWVMMNHRRSHRRDLDPLATKRHSFVSCSQGFHKNTSDTYSTELKQNSWRLASLRDLD